MMRPLLLCTVLLMGCASGPWYWTRANATDAAFEAEHLDCARGAMIAYNVGSEQAYKSCMRQKGWTRVQGSGTQPPDVPHFRGIEDDNHFALGPRELQERVNLEQSREPISGSALQCERSKGTFSQRPAPGVICP